ncbi:MAG: hypothetical protein HY744_08230 [Deltaproteobacteria bacterium]|nr:hypothetical protein [Deltaproteobacteria bacterium]
MCPVRPVNVQNLQNLDTASSGYIGDANRQAIGKLYRVRCYNDGRYAYAFDNSKSFNEGWNTAALWRGSYSANPNDYTEQHGDDCAPSTCKGPAYQGRNWAREGYTGCGLFPQGQVYGGKGYVFVK